MAQVDWITKRDWSYVLDNVVGCHEKANVA